MITVLWLDDEYNDPEMVQFAIEAENEGFYLEGYKSGEKGFSVLEKNLSRFDLILLDGLFYEKEEQVVDENQNLDRRARWRSYDSVLCRV